MATTSQKEVRGLRSSFSLLCSQRCFCCISASRALADCKATGDVGLSTWKIVVEAISDEAINPLSDYWFGGSQDAVWLWTGCNGLVSMGCHVVVVAHSLNLDFSYFYLRCSRFLKHFSRGNPKPRLPPYNTLPNKRMFCFILFVVFVTSVVVTMACQWFKMNYPINKSIGFCKLLIISNAVKWWLHMVKRLRNCICYAVVLPSLRMMTTGIMAKLTEVHMPRLHLCGLP